MGEQGDLGARGRYVGILYLAMAALMIFAFMYIPSRMIVGGDAAATAGSIEAHEQLYRIGIATGAVSHLLFIFLALGLYGLFKDVDRRQAALIVTLIAVGAAVEVGNFANRLAPLVLLSGADYLAAFTLPQLEALSLAFIGLGNRLGQLALIFWGLWLIPFGNLAIRSGYVPRVFGWLLYATAAAYLLTFITAIVLPDHSATVSRFVFPLYFGKLGIVFWLIIVGAKEPGGGYGNGP